MFFFFKGSVVILAVIRLLVPWGKFYITHWVEGMWYGGWGAKEALGMRDVFHEPADVEDASVRSRHHWA